VEADTKFEAEDKAMALASQQDEWENSTGITAIRVEGVEVLETETPKTSDLAWVRDTTSSRGETIE